MHNNSLLITMHHILVCSGHSNMQSKHYIFLSALLKTEGNQRKLESKGKSKISGENCNLERYEHPNVHSSTIHNSQVMEAATDRWRDEDVVPRHNGISLTHKKNETS